MKNLLNKLNKKYLALGLSILFLSIAYIIASSPPQRVDHSFCDKLLSEQDEIKYSLNKIDFYLRDLKANEADLKKYKDQVYFQSQQINKDLYTDRASPQAVCVVIEDNYEDLIGTLESCKQLIGSFFISMAPNWKACRVERIERDFEEIDKIFEKMK